jgi:hypothetical protein
MRRIVLFSLLAVSAVLAACSDAGRGEPQRVEVTLSPADRAWLEELVDGKLGLRAPALARRHALALEQEPIEEQELVEPAAYRIPVDRKMRLVDDGPVALATYNSGGKLYEGSQIETEAGWERHGPWQAWHDDGQLWEAGTYYEGEEHGLWEWWYANGQPQARGEYDEGRRVGPWTYYHENGVVMAQGAYDHDRPIGLWTVHDESGVLVSETDHDADGK